MSESTRPYSWTAERTLKDVAWLAALLGVSKSWVYQQVEAGKLPVVRIGALVRFDKRTIQTWLDSGAKLGR